MATEHNRRFAVSQRRQRITELYLQGWSQAAIASELNIAQSTVSDDVQHVRKKWHESAVKNFDQLRALELQKLAYIEREAWAAWQRSQKPAQSAVVSGEGAGQHTRKSMKNQIGDPRFLQQVNHCIAQRRALMGLDVLPAPNPLEGQPDGTISLEVRRERVLALIHSFGERERIGAAGAGSDDGQPGDVRDGDQRGPVEDGQAPGPAGQGPARID
jgi:hypothetical protein